MPPRQPNLRRVLALRVIAFAVIATAATSGCVVRGRASGDGAAQTTSSSVSRGTGATMPPSRTPQTREQCAACGGDWAVHGIAQVESCVCRTSDGGKRCRDGGECQGMCLADRDNPEFEATTAATGGAPARGYFVGRCSDRVTVFGCNRRIPRGATARGPVAASEPPSMMCVD